MSDLPEAISEASNENNQLQSWSWNQTHKTVWTQNSSRAIKPQTACYTNRTQSEEVSIRKKSTGNANQTIKPAKKKIQARTKRKRTPIPGKRGLNPSMSLLRHLSGTQRRKTHYETRHENVRKDDRRPRLQYLQWIRQETKSHLQFLLQRQK